MVYAPGHAVILLEIPLGQSNPFLGQTVLKLALPGKHVDCPTQCLEKTFCTQKC